MDIKELLVIIAPIAMLGIDLIFQNINGKNIEKLKNELGFQKDQKLIYSNRMFDCNDSLFSEFSKALNIISEFKKDKENFEVWKEAYSILSELDKLLLKSQYIDNDMNKLYSEFIDQYRLTVISYDNYYKILEHSNFQKTLEETDNIPLDLNKIGNEVKTTYDECQEKYKKLKSIHEVIRNNFQKKILQS